MTHETRLMQLLVTTEVNTTVNKKVNREIKAVH